MLTQKYLAKVYLSSFISDLSLKGSTPLLGILTSVRCLSRKERAIHRAVWRKRKGQWWNMLISKISYNVLTHFQMPMDSDHFLRLVNNYKKMY